MSESAPGVRELALFPLGLVLLPSMVLPLRVFEPRYQQLLQDVRQTDGRFGVVLIQRGSEVGQSHHDFDSARARVGTVARILQADTADDGTSTILILGETRFRVTEWLPDQPYPRALIEGLADLQNNHERVDPARLEELLAATRRNLAELRQLLEQGGHRIGPMPESDKDPAIAAFQLSAAAPLQPYDQQKLLEAANAQDRLQLLGTLTDELCSLLRMQREFGS